MSRQGEWNRREVLALLAAGVGAGVVGARGLPGWAAAGAAVPAGGGIPDYPDDWFRQARYGVMVSFLGGGPGWNDRVDAFDVEVFADQMAGAQAGYVLFTLGQNSGYYCSPNSAYDGYAGYAAGDRCSVRDLPRDLADALAGRGIPLLLYLPSRAPQGDAQALAGLSAHPDNDQFLPAPQEFTRKWSEVIEEWSLRYGRQLRGWWFDGAYRTDGWDDLSQPYNWNTWAASCRAGNSDSILAFNRGLPQFGISTDQQDYTAGEVNGPFTQTPATDPAPAGVQWHALGHVGSTWGFIVQDDPQHTDEELIAYLAEVNTLSGVVTLDVAVTDGRVHEPHLRQIEALGAAVRQWSPPPPSSSTTSPPETQVAQPATVAPNFTG